MADPRKVNVTTMADPKFVTLTGKPANQTAFKVVRKDGDPTMTTPTARKRVRRSDALVAVNFAAGTDEAAITATMNDWGVTDYTVEVSETGARAILRSDVSADQTMSVAMPDGVTATVLKPISNTTSDTKTAVAVARIDFALDAFPDLADVEDWLKRNDIPTESVQIKRGDLVTTAIRIDCTEVETHSMNVDSGVDFQVIRSESSDIPSNFLAVVSDTAYGSWGWGQLDFSAALADHQFCDLTEEASYMLRRVLDQILFYGDVPVEARKALVKNAVNQYADYLIALMSGLPTKVAIAIRSSNTKENAVSTTDKGTVNRSDATKTDDKSVDTKAPEATNDAGAITRADVTAMIQEAMGTVTGQLSSIETMLTQRAEATAAPAAGGEQGKQEATPEDAKRSDGEGKTDEQPSLEQVLRSVGELSTSMKAMQDTVSKLQGTTVVRSDGTDPAEATPKAGEQKDVFRGVFGRKPA